MYVDDVDVEEQDACAFLVPQFQKHLKEEDSMLSKSELQRYLMEGCEDDEVKFDILGWWKLNSTKYRILSQVACDVLAMLVSTVASESAFGIGGRVLDPFRSTLSHKTMEALICAQNWVRSSTNSFSFFEMHLMRWSSMRKSSQNHIKWKHVLLMTKKNSCIKEGW